MKDFFFFFHSLHKYETVFAQKEQNTHFDRITSKQIGILKNNE